MESVFGPNGPLASCLPGYESRSQQVHMATAVATALEEGHHLVVEAGPGTGKTLAYLVPAIVSQRRVVVSTGTRALQDQIFHKDLPLLESCLHLPFRAALMKGRSNYLCLRRLREALSQSSLPLEGETAQIRILSTWGHQTETGDRSELDAVPDDSPLWDEVCASAETCLGQACADQARCFITRMRQRAAASDLVVVNHHLFFSDLVLRRGGYGAVLPRYEAIVFDEAHQLEDAATKHLGVSWSTHRVEHLVRDVLRGLQMLADSHPQRVRQTLDRIRGCVMKLLDSSDVSEGRLRLRPPRIPQSLWDLGPRLMDLLDLLGLELHGLGAQLDDITLCAMRAESLSTELRGILTEPPQGWVSWMERAPRSIHLMATPTHVGPLLKEVLYGMTRCLIFTSATLSTEGNFSFFRKRLGLPDDTRELALPSPFDHRNQTLMYVPSDLPEPSSPQFVPRIAERIVEILHYSNGRAFVLFTSHRNLREVSRRIQPHCPFPLLVQGEAPAHQLLNQFRRMKGAVLLGTGSFWEGIDVTGDALSCVIIDKLPFEVPNDPVVEANIEMIHSQGGNPFLDYQVPGAIITLKQGLGRLIRTRKDRGVLCILDVRLRSRAYGARFLKSLPPCVLVEHSAEIERFFHADR